MSTQSAPTAAERAAEILRPYGFSGYDRLGLTLTIAAAITTAETAARAQALEEAVTHETVFQRLSQLEMGGWHGWHWILRSMWGGGIEQYGGRYVCTIYPLDSTGPYDCTCDGVGDTPELAISRAVELAERIAALAHPAGQAEKSTE